MIALHLLWIAALLVIAGVWEDHRKARMADLELQKRMDAGHTDQGEY